ncbi:MAG TPA: OB-fold domain-containing protein [Candidatus Macondimonas sp.]|nr:OB-fold domain-containing protein [Candidatus Macondimonas sp.]
MAKQVPLEEGYLVIPEAEGERPRLLGSYSPEAKKYFFPRRMQCPITETPVEDVELSSEGVLYSWTWVLMPFMGAAKMGDGKAHGVGQIDLPEGVRVQAVISGQMGDWEIGMPMGLIALPVKKKGDTELCTFGFEPIRKGE